MLEDRVELPRSISRWHSPAMFAADDAELDLAADLLAHGKTSRLYKSLVYERQIATDVSAYQHSREMSGLFQIACTAAPGVALPSSSGGDRRDVASWPPRPDRDELERGAGADRGAVRLPPADDRRLRRQVRSAERLQRLSPATPVTSTPIARATIGDRRRHGRGRARLAGRRAAVVAQRRAARRARSALPTPSRSGLVTASIARGCPVPGARRPFAFPTHRARDAANGLELRVVVASGPVPVRSIVLLVPGGSSPIPRPRTVWPRSPPICWTKAAAVSRRSRWPTRRPHRRRPRRRGGPDAGVIA